jgi:glycylpeptide N-tetradecanoyltransferase
VIGHPKHETVKAAYSFYNVSTKTSWKNLMNDTLILAKQRDFDVFNALDLMENKKSFIDELKFGMGDGHLQYYLFNWSCPDIPSQRNGLVLL